MAILRANPDGSSNAKVGDVVVTGGGVFQKTVNGSIPWTNANGENVLKDLVGVASTGSSALVDKAYNLLVSKGVSDTTKTKTNVIDEVLNNTQVFDSASNYDSFTTPDYSTSGSGGSTFNFGNIFGYAIVGLVLIVVADKFIGGGK
jgi:hypothetical protein